MKLKGISIFVNDINKATDSYSKLFNKKPRYKNENSAGFFFDKTRFFIHKKVKVSPEFPYSEDHFEFSASNVDKEFKRLKKLGFKVETEPTDFFWGRSAFLRDKEGRLLEINQKSS